MKYLSVSTLILITLLFYNFSGKNKLPSDLLNKKMPDLKTATIDNTSITSDLFRNKVSLVNFMYFGCKPCMIEIPTLNNISSSFSAEQFQIISIAAHTKEEIVAFLSDSISAFSSVRKHYGINTINYKIIAECNPKKTNEFKDEITLGCNTLSKKFHVRGYPTTFLIDKMDM